MIISGIEQLEKEAGEIQAYLEITMSDDPAEAVQRGNDLTVYIARTGKMLADARLHQDQRMKSTIMVKLKEIGRDAGVPATTMNNLIKSSCYMENYLVTFIDRLNRTATHQLEWCRTLVSKAKTELQYSGNHPT